MRRKLFIPLLIAILLITLLLAALEAVGALGALLESWQVMSRGVL